MPIQLQWDGGGGFGRGSDRMGAPGSGTDQGSSSLLDSEGAWLAASAHLLHLRVCLSGCVCVGVDEAKHSLCGSMTDLTLVTLHHTPTLMHTRTHTSKSIRYTLWQQQKEGTSTTHAHTNTQIHTHKNTLQCDWWLCDTHHRASFSGPVRAAFVRGDLGRGKAEYGIECGKKKKELLIAARELEGICNHAALLIRAPRTTANDKKRGGGTFYPR